MNVDQKYVLFRKFAKKKNELKSTLDKPSNVLETLILSRVFNIMKLEVIYKIGV